MVRSAGIVFHVEHRVLVGRIDTEFLALRAGLQGAFRAYPKENFNLAAPRHCLAGTAS